MSEQNEVMENEASGQEPRQVQPAAADDKVTRMGTAPVGKLLAEFAVPALVSVIVSALYNVIDSIFLGNATVGFGAGEIGLAATTVAAPIMTITAALSMLAGQGGNSLTAILLGEGKRDRAERTLGNTVTIMFIIAVFVAIIATFFLDPMLRLVGATDRTLPASRLFMQIILYGTIFGNFAYGVSNFIRTAGAPNYALWVSIAGTIACIGFNYLFVIVLGLGVAGSAGATVIGQAVSTLFVVYFFTLNKKAPFKLRARHLRLDGEICRRLLVLGLAPFSLQVAASIMQVVGNMVLAHWGALDVIGTDGAMASIGVVMKITSFIVFPVIGIAIAAQPILGYNIGARKYDRVRRCLILALITATCILVVLFILIHVIPEQLVGLFGVDPELMDFSVYALKIQTIFIPFIAIQIVGSNYFQATGQPFKSMALSLTRQLLFTIPMFIVCPIVVPKIIPSFTSLMGFSFTYPMSDLMAIILCAIFLGIEFRRLNGLIAQQKQEVQHA